MAPLIGRYCGTKIPPEIQSSSGLLSLSFHTDMAVAKDGFSARYNLTRKEVSDCKCQMAWNEDVFAPCVGLFPSAISFPNLLLTFKHRQLFWRSSSFDSSYPADLCRPAYINVLRLSVVFLPWELTLSEADVCYFLLNINEVHLNLPLFTCWRASCLPSLLLCLHLTFFFTTIYFF